VAAAVSIETLQAMSVAAGQYIRFSMAFVVRARASPVFLGRRAPREWPRWMTSGGAGSVQRVDAIPMRALDRTSADGGLALSPSPGAKP
jgi:hypothetical protein